MTTTAITRPDAPALPDLTPQQELALLARILHREGYDDHVAGHLTYRQPDGTLLCNPFRLTWDELRAGDIMRIDIDGNVLDGQWTVTPAIELHLALHQARDDAVVAVHNHPRWGTIWADLQRIPPVYDQTSGIVADDIALFDEYEGTVVSRANAEQAVAALGSSQKALLANHGVFVVGPDIARTYRECAVLEWRCRNAWHVEAVGDGVPLKPDIAAGLAAYVARVSSQPLFEAMARREIRRDRSVLEEEPLTTVL